MNCVEEMGREVDRWLSYGTPQGLVTSARVLRHKSQPVVPSVVVFVVRKIWTIGVVKEGAWMVVEDLRTTQMGKKRRLEEKRQYCHELVNMKPRLRDRPCWA